MRQPIGDGDVPRRDLDVLHELPRRRRMLHRLVLPLVLVQERDRANERQVFHMVPPAARAAVQERQPVREGIGHQHRIQKPLRVPVHREHRRALPLFQKAGQGLALRCMM